MTLSRRRQMNLLERLARPAIEKNQKAIDKKFCDVAEQFYQDGLTHASNLSLLITFGEPQEGEPLERAWDRCLASEAPELRKALPNSKYSPFDDRSDARTIADFFRHFALPRLEATGGNDAEKLIAIISQAPPWLLWFTYADLTSEALSLEPLTGHPEFSSFAKYARSRLDYVRWPLLPRGALHRQANRVFREDMYRAMDLCDADEPDPSRSLESIQKEVNFYLEPSDKERITRKKRAILERYGHLSGHKSPLFNPALQKDRDRLEQAFNSTLRHWPFWH